MKKFPANEDICRKNDFIRAFVMSRMFWKKTQKSCFLYLIFLFPLIFILGCYSANDKIFAAGNYADYRVGEIEYLQEDFLLSLPNEYSFLVLTDIHFGSKRLDAPELEQTVTSFFEWLDSLTDNEKPKFCLVLGDITDTGRQNQFDDYLEFSKKIEENGIKVFNAVGNHDIYEDHWDNWKKNCYPHSSFYTFSTQSFSFYSLDTASSNFGSKQLKRIKENLEKDKKPKVIFTHYPFFSTDKFFGMSDSTERNLALSYFAKNNVKLVLGGHLHYKDFFDCGDFQTYSLPSFRFKKQWAVVKMDESLQKYSLEIIQGK